MTYPTTLASSHKRPYNYHSATEAQRYKNSPRCDVVSAVDIKWLRGRIFGSAACRLVPRYNFWFRGMYRNSPR